MNCKHKGTFYIKYFFRIAKIFLLKCLNFVKATFTKPIYVGEYVTDRNFGDALNYVLLKKMYNATVIPKRFCFDFQYKKHDNLLFIGSVMKTADERSIVWGAGIMSRNEKVNGVKKIYSVRGPITQNILISQGYDCPSNFGDPALLMPRIYNPPIKCQYEIGFVPHFLDKSKHVVNNLIKRATNNVLYIDIQMPVSKFSPAIYKNYKLFLNKIISCDVIVASCLHGLIMGDAYGKKTLWIKFGNDIGGDDVKFYDYYTSMGIKESDIAPLLYEELKYSWSDLRSMATLKPVNNINMDIFLKQNPFESKILIS